MRKVYEIGGLPHFHQIENEASELRHKRKSRFRLMHKLRKGGKKDKAKEWHNYTGPNGKLVALISFIILFKLV